ncbi:hypothetical protein [Natranaeroarchaeum aerophilus]|uniref:Uncharacterized protein n=1 Tax=Natranaeroarchaeum aerophilus TaxID=2917711 RepID=A0AAE3FQF9_9EURY|nr:hypothetical protein [Natranaeroarchaeum aerophilus]MCL9813692.1 hypothetical protein [Natranaeroarchaeum aerophilus]
MSNQPTNRGGFLSFRRWLWLFVVLAMLGSVLVVVSAVGVAGTAVGEESIATNTAADTDAEMIDGVEIRGPLVGITAENVEESEEPPSDVVDMVADHLGVDDRQVVYDRSEATLEVRSDDISEEQFESALDEVGLNGDETEIRSGVTDETGDLFVEIVDSRLADAGYDNATVSHTTDADGTTEIVVEAPARDRERLRSLITDRNDVAIVIHHPSDTEAGYEEDVLLTREDVASIGSVEQPEQSNQYRVPLVITDSSAPEYVDQLQESGITTEGVNNCAWSEAGEPPYGYCQLITIDDEEISGLSMTGGLAEQINDGTWVNNPVFVITSPDASTAEDVRSGIEHGPLPTSLDLDQATEREIELDIDTGDEDDGVVDADEVPGFGLIVGLLGVTVTAYLVARQAAVRSFE